MKLSFFKLGLRVAIFQLGLLLCQTGLAAVGFTVTPAAVSNTYAGPITLQVTGLTAGDTVVVQKFLDANTNGVIDGGDLLWQQFNLTDGSNVVIGGVTNNNVPGDSDGTANGTITAKLNFQSDWLQTFAGNYLVKLSSPAGHFTPITNSFTVTNFPYAQKFTGTVVSNGVAVPNAVIILLPANSNPVGGAVANNSGIYTLPAPAGSYSLIPFKTNFVATRPTITLGNNATINTNLSLIAATQSISGKIVDTNNSSIGLPGIIGIVQSQDKSLAGFFFTDTNGNFIARVNANQWNISGNSADFALHGYLELQNKTVVDTTSGSVSGVTIAVPKGTACFYGTVKDNLGNPLSGVVAIYADDNNNGLYEADGYTDTNGNYVTVVVGGLGSSDPWQVSIDNSSSFPNYIFSQPAFDQNGGTNLNVGQAVVGNFTAILATNHITGNVKFNGSPIIGVQIKANSQDANNYQAQATTDSNGNYSMNVANDSWYVYVNCQGGDGSLDGILGSGNYQCPCGYNITVSGNNVATNFIVLPGGTGEIFGYVTNSVGNPIVGVNVYATDCNGDYDSTYTDGNGYYSFNNVANYIYDVSVDCGGLSNQGYQCVSDQNVTVSSDSIEQDFIPQAIPSPLQITTTYLPNGTNTTFYSQTLQASGGQTPYSWAVADYSALPSNLTLDTNGILSGTLADTADTYYFDVVVTDDAANTNTQTLSLTIVNPPLPPLVITNASLPNGNVGAAYSAQLGATGGQSPYYWTLFYTSSPLPVGLYLNTSGLISGTPTTNKPSIFKFQVQDQNGAITNKVLSITINPDPVLSLPDWLTNQFQMRLTGAANQNYTIQVSTNLSSANWTTLFITNNAVTNSFIVVDPTATNKQRFYRAVIGP